MCECRDGTHDPPACHDIDECLTETHECHQNANCYNLRDTRKYTCACKLGYSGDGFQCSKADLCVENNIMCGPNGHCEQVMGFPLYWTQSRLNQSFFDGLILIEILLV